MKLKLILSKKSPSSKKWTLMENYEIMSVKGRQAERTMTASVFLKKKRITVILFYYFIL